MFIVPRTFSRLLNDERNGQMSAGYVRKIVVIWKWDFSSQYHHLKKGRCGNQAGIEARQQPMQHWVVMSGGQHVDAVIRSQLNVYDSLRYLCPYELSVINECMFLWHCEGKHTFTSPHHTKTNYIFSLPLLCEAICLHHLIWSIPNMKCEHSLLVIPMFRTRMRLHVVDMKPKWGTCTDLFLFMLLYHARIFTDIDQEQHFLQFIPQLTV